MKALMFFDFLKLKRLYVALGLFIIFPREQASGIDSPAFRASQFKVRCYTPISPDRIYIDTGYLESDGNIFVATRKIGAVPSDYSTAALGRVQRIANRWVMSKVLFDSNKGSGILPPGIKRSDEEYEAVEPLEQLLPLVIVNPANGLNDDPNAPTIMGYELMPDAMVNVNYKYSFVALGGQPPYAWETFLASDVADRFALDPSSGILSGKAVKPGGYDIVIVVTDGQKRENRRIFTGFVRPAVPLPNLTPYKPTNWTDKMIVSLKDGSYVDSKTIYDSQVVHVYTAELNNSETGITNAYVSSLYLDGIKIRSWLNNPLKARDFSTHEASYLTLPAGTHTLRLQIDEESAIPESNKDDNSYTKTVTIRKAPMPTLAFQRSGLSAAEGRANIFLFGLGKACSRIEFITTRADNGRTDDCDLSIDYPDGSEIARRRTTIEWNGSRYVTRVNGNNESVGVNNPPLGDYRIELSAFAAYTDVTLEVFVYPIVVEDWWKAIETQPARPANSESPTRSREKDSLVVVTHGWQPLKPDIAWMTEMTNKITSYLRNRGLNNWRVHAHNWVEKAHTTFPAEALHNGEEEGSKLGTDIASQAWNHVHLIGHSAGSALIQAAATAIRNKQVGQTKTSIHLTFLDPYLGLRYGGKEKYGKDADWVENYFSRDATVLTDSPLPLAYNVDVTWLDSTRKPLAVAYPGIGGKTCSHIVSSHGWPHDFYSQTIPTSKVEGAGEFGFLLSKEAGSWDTLKTRFPPSDEVRRLGNGDIVCVPSGSELTVSERQKPNLTGAETIKSDAGKVQIHGIDSFSLTTASPAWLAVPVITTNIINIVNFYAQFKSGQGAEGLLSVFWNGQRIGLLDERAGVTEMRKCTFVMNAVPAKSEGVLVFRLDSFSEIGSSIALTNVSLGFLGASEPIVLSASNSGQDSAAGIQLIGPPGFNYLLESSTNLIDWEPTAIFIHTNRVGRFMNFPPSREYSRFYRAVIP